MKYIILICILTLTGIAFASPSRSGYGKPVAEGEMRVDHSVLRSTAAEPMNGPPAASTKPLPH